MHQPAKTEYSKSNYSISSLELVKNELERVKKVMDTQLYDCPDRKRHIEVNHLLESVNHHSGKMIRPGLVLLSGKCFDCITDVHIKVAACIEMIHNATLLHDDVIDEGSQRRGKPTINSLWGNESAVLLGDFMLSHVFKLSAKLNPRVTKVLADAAVRLCEGELAQIVQKDNWEMSESEYINIITEKSASLFSYSCYLGAILANAHEHQATLFSEFGLNAGIAFQIADDLLDIIGDEKTTGKTIGSDADKHKPTLAVIHFRRSDLAARHSKSRVTNIPVSELKKAGSLEYASIQAQKYVSLAIGALDSIQQCNAKSALIETAKFMADRVR